MTKGKAPISSHRAFPAIVALWFAELLGIGSLVLPVVLLEKAATLSGIAAVWPAAQPPLGLTARLAIALAAGGIGALLGLWLAAKVAATQALSTPRRRQPAPARDSDWGESAKRPISARDELGSDSLDDAGDEADRSAALGRRRPLAVTEETGRSDFLECAPLPGAGAY
ncbi:MAG: hypothetical protein ACTHKM_05770, partial [Tsuneonella sp.]